MALTEKQARFVAEYLVDLNATEAAIKAGYSEKTAYSIGFENLRKPEIAAAIQQAMEERQKRTQITQDRVLAELARVAFANGSDFARVVRREVPMTIVDEEGKLQTTTKVQQVVEVLDTSTISPEKRAAISHIKEGKHGIEVGSYDKVRALELLGKHLGLFDTRTPPTAESESNLLDVLMAGTEEDMNTDDLPEVQ